MKFRPLHDRVVVRRVEEDTKTKGGIIIPDTAQEKPMQGEVIAVGPGGRDENGKLVPIDVKVGQTIFGKWSGNDVKIDGVEYLIMKESDIMGVINLLGEPQFRRESRTATARLRRHGLRRLEAVLVYKQWALRPGIVGRAQQIQRHLTDQHREVVGDFGAST